MPKIRSEGRDWDFQPGPNGSLTSPAEIKAPLQGLELNEPTSRAKTVPSPAVDAEKMTKNKVAMNVANTMMNGRFGYK